MMSSLSGELGIGKTYHLAKEVYERFKRGCLCITNFKHVYSHICVRNDPELLIEMIRQVGEFKRRGYELCDLLPEFKHSGIFMAIDEAHLTFNSEYKGNENMGFILQFLSLARKQDVDIWYVVQDPAKIHKNFRRYTNDWYRFRAMIPVFRNKFVKHPTRPTFRREKRLIIPLVWQELHRLDYENPVFNYARTHSEEGFSGWSPRSTILKRKLRRTSDRFIHKMYDSHEMVGMKLSDDDEQRESFALLKDVAYIRHTMKKEHLPTLKKLLHIRGSDSIRPTRFKFRSIDLPDDVDHDIAEKTVKQPVEFLDDIMFFNKKKKGNKIISINRMDKPKMKNKILPPIQKKKPKGMFDFLSFSK